jgi:hypothetical protein
MVHGGPRPATVRLTAAEVEKLIEDYGRNRGNVGVFDAQRKLCAVKTVDA